MAVHKQRYTIGWLLMGMALIAIVVVAAIMNYNYQLNGTTKIDGTITTDNGDLKINWNRYDNYEVELSETYTITKSGVYHFTGSLSDGAIIINTTAEDVVKIILDNVSINNSNGPAIACYLADDLVVELIGENTLSDGKSYSANYNEDVKGAIYANADLTFEGEGTLNLFANYQDGIVSKDDLKFNSGAYNITAIDDGVRGKDSVYIVDGSFKIDAGGDAIKSTNEITAGKGFVLIEKGSFELTSVAKAIKAINSILIYSGTFNIKSTDDAIHSNNYVGITDGDFVISSGDDGIHADKELIVDGGKIDIEKSYEGLEAQVITINNGEISIVASDDGINAGGGADGSANNRIGAGTFDADMDCALSINGGKVYVNSSGDGIDSNGYLYFNGGEVVVDGPTNNGNGALDSGAGIIMNGGKVIAVGASGMAETLGGNSSVYNISIYFPSMQTTGTTIAIKDSDDKTIINHTSAKTFNHIAVGSSDFKLGSTYTIYINGAEYQSFTISDITTTINNANQNMMQRKTSRSF